jgi:DNA-binding GntR family transcriptional regulator
MGPRLRTVSVVDALHEQLKGRILDGSEGPGTSMTELSISGGYGVSRPTARAAIERLIADGLLVRTGRKSGPYVPELSREDIADLYATRVLVETEAYCRVGAAGTSTAGAVARNAGLRQAAARGDAAGVVDADVAFHRELIALAGSSRLSRLHDLLLTEAHLCMAQVQSNQLLTAAEIADEHDAILAAIAGGDPERIRAVSGEHLARAERKLTAHLFGSG